MLVEFAVIGPLLLVLLFGVLSWGESTFIQHQVVWASAELARGAGVGEDAGDRQAIFEALDDQVLGTFLFPACAAAELSDDGQWVTVSVSYDTARQETCRVVPPLPFVPSATGFESQRNVLVGAP